MIKQSNRSNKQTNSSINYQISTQSKQTEEDNVSVNSDISTNMDSKVFRGAFNNLKTLNDEIKEKSNLTQNKYKNYKNNPLS